MLGLDKNKRYLLACSYGPDSMALFKLLLDEGYSFDVAHVNYNLREESKEEEYNLMEFCEGNQINYNVKVIAPNSIKGNLEEQCRNIRYSFFKSIFNSYDALLVAHNQDDLLETYLLQKKRKSIVQYYGLKKVTTINGMTVIRPLLGSTKTELQKLCDDTNVPYSIDKTNLEDVHERNKIRHSIVQKMNMNKRLEMIGEIDSLNQDLETKIDNLNHMDLQNIKVLQALDIKELAMALHIEARKLQPNAEMSMSQIKEIRKVILSKKPNVSMAIKNELILLKEYNHLYFKIDEQDKNYTYVLNEPCELNTPYFYLDFTKDTKDRNICLDDYPLTIRNCRASDTYKIKNYDKNINRLLIDWKVPQSLRKRYPVIINKEGIIKFIPRYRKDFVIDESLNFYIK